MFAPFSLLNIQKRFKSRLIYTFLMLPKGRFQLPFSNSANYSNTMRTDCHNLEHNGNQLRHWFSSYSLVGIPLSSLSSLQYSRNNIFVLLRYLSISTFVYPVCILFSRISWRGERKKLAINNDTRFLFIQQYTDQMSKCCYGLGY